MKPAFFTLGSITTHLAFANISLGMPFSGILVISSSATAAACARSAALLWSPLGSCLAPAFLSARFSASRSDLVALALSELEFWTRSLSRGTTARHINNIKVLLILLSPECQFQITPCQSDVLLSSKGCHYASYSKERSESV